VCDLETSRMGAPYIYIYDISRLRVNIILSPKLKLVYFMSIVAGLRDRDGGSTGDSVCFSGSN